MNLNQLKPLTQKSESGSFYDQAARILEWGSMAGETVMDIGFGSGNSSRVFASRYPDIEKLIAIDVFENVVAEAQKENQNPKIEYRGGDICQKESLMEWQGAIDKVISVFCFNCLPDLRLHLTAYQNVFDLLKPGGHAAILQSMNSDFYTIMEELCNDPRWQKQTATMKSLIPKHHILKTTLEQHRDMLRNSGLEVVFCDTEHKARRFSSKEEFGDMVMKSCPVSSTVSSESKEEFIDHALQILQKHKPKNTTQLEIGYTILSVFLKKPLNVIHS